MRNRPRLGCLLLLPIGMVGPAGLLAQEYGAGVIEEIVVTAQKREQNLSDVSVAVRAFSGDEVRANRLLQPNDLAAQTPNLNINETFGNSITNVSIRGLGLNDYAVNNNPAAGIYVDDVYLVSPAMLSFQLFDLERVEVLLGPQGTLYGRNTTAGAVRFISRRPSDEFEGYVSLDYGRYDEFLGGAAVGGPLAPGLRGRVAVQLLRRGTGFQTNRTTGNKIGELDRVGWRGLLEWAPVDGFDVLLNLHGGTDESDTLLVKVDNLLTPEDDGILDPYSSAAGAGTPTELDNEAFGASLEINWRLDDTLTLTSVTGYESFDRFHAEDRDGSALVQLDGQFANDIEQISQELRLTWITARAVLIGGLFYGSDEVFTRDNFNAADLLPLLGVPADAVGNEYLQEADSLAGFAHLEWQLNDNFNLITGLRYTSEEKDFGGAYTFLFFGDLEVPLYPSVSHDYEVNNLSGKVGLEYVGLESSLLYAHVSRGFKSGNFQGQLAFNPADLEGFGEEIVTAFEAGVKTRLMDGRLRFESAIFFYDYEDVQIYGPIYDSVVGPLFGITNAGDAEVYGAEANLLWLTGVGLDVRLGLGLLDTEITKSFVDNVAGGSRLPNAPKVNFNAALGYETRVSDSVVAEFSVDASFKGKVTYDIVNQPPEAWEGGYWIANARAGVRAVDDRWGVYLWGKNITDELYRTQVLTSSVGFGANYGLPATWGVSLDLRF